MLARLQINRFLLQFADAHFGPRQIGHNRDAAPRCVFGRSQISDNFLMTRKIPMGEIKPRHVHSGENHLLHHFPRLRSRPDRTNQFCLVSRPGHNSSFGRKRDVLDALNATGGWHL